VGRHPDDLTKKSGQDPLAVTRLQQRLKPVDEPFRIKRLARERYGKRLVQDKLAKIPGEQRGFQGAEATEGVPEKIRGFPHRVYDSRDVFELTLEGIGAAITALTPTPPVNRIDAEVLPERWN
jgi:hypothetical protein